MADERVNVIMLLFGSFEFILMDSRRELMFAALAPTCYVTLLMYVNVTCFQYNFESNRWSMHILTYLYSH